MPRTEVRRISRLLLMHLMHTCEVTCKKGIMCLDSTFLFLLLQDRSPALEPSPATPTSPSSNAHVYVSKAQDVVTNMLAKGSAMRQDAVNKAKAFDEKHRLTANASAKVIAFDRRVGLTEKLNVGISVVNEKVKSVDQRLHVSDKTMAALLVAEKKLNDTGTTVKSSR